MAIDRARWTSFAIYTLLRVALFLIVFGLFVWLTPLTGVYAAALAILVSSIIAIPLLSRQRDRLSMGVAGFFTRMNERIEASTRAEDDDPDVHSHERDSESEH